MSAGAGSLALARATLFVGTQAKTAHVRAFDLGGRELALGFSFRDPVVGRSAVSGLAVDRDHTLWIADLPADRVRRFSVFGRELGGLGPGGLGREAVLPGALHRPVDVEVVEGECLVACAGEGLHAVQRFDGELAFRARCCALGDPTQPFRGVARLSASGRRLLVAETLARRVQVFRGGEFHFAFQLADARGRRLEPCAVAALEDGRALVACRAPESALLLVDPSGRVIGVLAGHGTEDGEVLEPSDVVVEAGAEDHRTRVFVLDRDGLRLQVLTLEGRSLGVVPLDTGRGADPGRERRGKKGGR